MGQPVALNSGESCSACAALLGQARDLFLDLEFLLLHIRDLKVIEAGAALSALNRL
jgi:hypothetical protein